MDLYHETFFEILAQAELVQISHEIHLFLDFFYMEKWHTDISMPKKRENKEVNVNDK